MQRAVALPEGHDVAVTIAEDLHLDVAGAIDAAFNKHACIAEELLAQTADALPRQLQRLAVGAAGQAYPAAARGAFQHHRVANLLRGQQRLVEAVQQTRPRRHRHASLRGQLPCPVFEAKLTNLLRRGANKDNARLLAGVGKGQALREKTVARPDSLRAALFSGINNAVDAQIAVAGLLSAERQGDICRLDVLGVFIRIGIDGDADDPQSAQGADGAAGDFAPVGNQYAIKHAASPCWRASSASLCKP